MSLSYLGWKKLRVFRNLLQFSTEFLKYFNGNDCVKVVLHS